MLKVYTLKSCDTCKKALKWLDAEGIGYVNHDVRSDVLMREDVEYLVRSLGWENALNRRSTTWRGLDESDKADMDAQKAIRLIVDHPTLLKRPVFVTEHEVMAGFSDDVRAWLKA